MWKKIKKKSKNKKVYFRGGAENPLRGTFSKQKFQVKVVKVGFANTSVKFVTTKVQRQKSFFLPSCHILYHCALAKV